MKTGKCKFGVSCKFHHPKDVEVPSAGEEYATALQNEISGDSKPVQPLFTPALLHNTKGLPIRLYYMKNGICKFGENCKFHHPIDRSPPTASAKESVQQNVELTLAGLPRREGAIHCPYYMKTGTCKYGATCKFDHPPPGEVLAMATSQGASASAGEDVEENGEAA